MQYNKYKKITYILSEKPGLSGRIAFEFLKEVIGSKNLLKFTFYGHGNKCFGLFRKMYDNIISLPCENDEEEFLINNFDIKSGLLKVLCLLGEFPNFLKISKLDSDYKTNKMNYSWCIEYSDETFTFTYLDKLIEDSKIVSIEQELFNKGIVYERKVSK